MGRFPLAATLVLCTSLAHSSPQFERVETTPTSEAERQASYERARDPEYQKHAEQVRCAFGMCKTYPWQTENSNSLVPPHALWETQQKHTLTDVARDRSLEGKASSVLRRNLYLGNESITPVWQPTVGDYDLWTANQNHPEIRSLRVRYGSRGSSRYQVYDGKLLPIYAGNDVGEIVGRVCEDLEQGKRGIVLGFQGFSEKETRAFTTEFSVQNALRDDKADSWSSVVGANGELLALYRAPEMKLDGMILDHPQKGWWRVRSRFSAGLRYLWVQTWFSSLQYVKEFVASLAGSASTNSRQSVEQAVERSKRQLIANHPELSEKQIYLRIRQEIRQTHLGEVLRLRRDAA